MAEISKTDIQGQITSAQDVRKKKDYYDLTDVERKAIGKKWHYCLGDGLTVFIFALIVLALCFSASFAVMGFIWLKSSVWLIVGIACTAATLLFIALIFPVKLWRKKRLAKKKEQYRELTENYSRDTLDQCDKFWQSKHWFLGLFVQM